MWHADSLFLLALSGLYIYTRYMDQSEGRPFELITGILFTTLLVMSDPPFNLIPRPRHNSKPWETKCQ